jgi:hypothetical protein
MSEIVFILGAGASKHAGAPLMAEFLDTARDLYAAGVPGISRSAFDRVFRAIADLQIVHSKSELDLINLESVFGAFEMARLIGSDLGSAERSATGGDELVSAMQRVITETLQETVLFPVQGAQIHAPAQYDAFAQFIQSLRGVNKRVAFITFNYDVALDYDLTRVRSECGPISRLQQA